MKKILSGLAVALLLTAGCSAMVTTTHVMDKSTLNAGLLNGEHDFKEFGLAEGETVKFSYQVEIEEGEVALQIEHDDTDDIEFKQTYTTSENGIIEFQAEKDGLYELEIHGLDAKNVRVIVEDVN